MGSSGRRASATFSSSWSSSRRWRSCGPAATPASTGSRSSPTTSRRDGYLPRQLTKRGHRLAFSNGILVLGVVALALVLIFDANVTGLVSLYAIGVFTGFTMAGLGMVAHHRRGNGPHRTRGIIVNSISAVTTFAVVLIFAIAKFTEGAWIVVVLGPLMYLGLIRLHRQYVTEDTLLRARVDDVSGTDRACVGTSSTCSSTATTSPRHARCSTPAR